MVMREGGWAARNGCETALGRRRAHQPAHSVTLFGVPRPKGPPPEVVRLPTALIGPLRAEAKASGRSLGAVLAERLAAPALAAAKPKAVRAAAKPKAVRLPAGLVARVDEARGDIPRERFVRQTLEAALHETPARSHRH